MNIIDIKREIAFSKLLGTELPDDIKELIDFFKELTYRHEKGEDGLETWYDSNDRIRINYNGNKWKYIYFSEEKLDLLQTKYTLNDRQTNELISGMLGIVTNGRVFPTISRLRVEGFSWE